MLAGPEPSQPIDFLVMPLSPCSITTHRITMLLLLRTDPCYINGADLDFTRTNRLDERGTSPNKANPYVPESSACYKRNQQFVPDKLTF